MAFLEVRGIKKQFGQLEVLKGINFDLEKGEVLSVIGSSGGGKTTLLRCLNMLEMPTSGRIYLNGALLFDAADGHKLSDAELRQKRLHFGLVFQNFNLFPQYNVKQNLMLAPRLLKRSLTGKEIRELRKKALFLRFKGKKDGAKEEIAEMNGRIAELQRDLKETLDGLDEKAERLLARVGLTDKKDAYPCQLSGGQCQRVAIARALALEPDILCFDEPTSALDPELTGEVLKVIRDLKKETTTMIIVTHEMEFARSVSDKVLFVSGGVIEEQGTPEEVFGAPKSEKTKSFLLKMEENV